jgi:hypothetical protein
VEAQVAGPGVEDGRDAELSAEPFRVGGKRGERVGGGAEDEVEQQPAVGLDEGPEEAGEREDDMVVAGGEDANETRGEPTRLSGGLALGTGPVSTGVVGRPGEAALVADVEVASEGGGPAGDDVVHGAQLKAVEGEALPGLFAVSSQDVRDLEPLLRSVGRVHGGYRMSGPGSKGLPAR